jgi:WD40 repeat protein
VSRRVSMAAALLGACLAAGADAEDGLQQVATITAPGGVKFRFSAVAPDGKQITVACSDSKLRVFALPAGTLLRTLETAGAAPTWLVYADKAARLAVSTRAGTVFLFATGDGAQVARVDTGGPSINTVALAPDASLLATIPDGKPAELWEVQTAQRRAVLRTDFGSSNSIAFSADGTRLASADEDTAVRVYDGRNGRLLTTTSDLLLETFAVRFSADGKQLLLGGADKRLTVVDAATAKVVRGMQGTHPMAWLEPLAGGRVLTGSFDEETMARPGPSIVWGSDGAPRVVAQARSFNGGGRLSDGGVMLTSLMDGALVVWAVP